MCLKDRNKQKKCRGWHNFLKTPLLVFLKGFHLRRREIRIILFFIYHGRDSLLRIFLNIYKMCRTSFTFYFGSDKINNFLGDWMMEYVWPIQNGQSASMLSRWYLSYSFCRFGALKGGTQGYFQSLLRNKQKVWGQRLTLCMHAFYSDDSSSNPTEI